MNRYNEYHAHQVALNAFLEIEDRLAAISYLHRQASIAEQLLELDPKFATTYTTRLGMSIRCELIPKLWREAAELLTDHA